MQMGDCTMMKDDYAAKVTDLAEREEAARLFEAFAKASTAYDATFNDDSLTEEQNAQLDAEYDKFRAARLKLEAEYDAAVTTIRSSFGGNADVARLKAEKESTERAYHEHPSSAVLTEDDEAVTRCALSGAPLYEDDDVIEYGDHRILAHLVIPDHLIEVEDEADVEIEDAA